MNTLQATRKEDMLWMRSQGYTLKEIGEHYGLSKQRQEKTETHTLFTLRWQVV